MSEASSNRVNGCKFVVVTLGVARVPLLDVLKSPVGIIFAVSLEGGDLRPKI